MALRLRYCFTMSQQRCHVSFGGIRPHGYGIVERIAAREAPGEIREFDGVASLLLGR